jgi:ketosteroid isomerase-like protein
MTKIDQIRRYFALLERFASERAEFEPVLHPEMEQREFPNLLNPKGQRSDQADLLRRAALGKNVLERQNYEITHAVESGDHLVVEAIWHGKMAIDAGPLKAGQVLQAYFCVVFEFKDSKIYRQRNYDCFEPFAK